MANEEQVKRLLAGVVQWNLWRKTYRGEIDLREANLQETNLGRADLRGAHLYRADLRKADLQGIALNEANLNEAILDGANLYRANLRGAHLQGAIFGRAYLNETVLEGSNLQGAKLYTTTFSHTDLRTTKGLSQVAHLGPSVVDLPTVQLPHDESGLVFLRGAGVPDEWIDLYRATMQTPIQYHSLFISYASPDQPLASRLHADLQNSGVRCWFAPHDLVPGDHFREKIDQAIQVQDKLLLILSKDSVQSQWVAHEVRRALNREVNQDRVVLFPIRIDEEVIQSTSRWAQDLKDNRHIGDFTGWESSHRKYQERFATLLSQLRTESKRP